MFGYNSSGISTRESSKVPFTAQCQLAACFLIFLFSCSSLAIFVCNLRITLSIYPTMHSKYVQKITLCLLLLLLVVLVFCYFQWKETRQMQQRPNPSLWEEPQPLSKITSRNVIISQL